MATPQNGESEPSRIIGSISKLAGALVGTAVVAGKRIIGEAAPPSKGPSDRPRGKTMQARAKRNDQTMNGWIRSVLIKETRYGVEKSRTKTGQA